MVKVGILGNGQVSVEFRACISQSNGAKHHHQNTEANIENGEGGRLQGRTQEAADGSPIKGDGKKAHSCLSAKQLVDKNIVWGDEARKSEDLEELGHDLRNPLVAECAGGNKDEELVPSNLPAVGERRVSTRVIVQGVHDGSEDQLQHGISNAARR